MNILVVYAHPSKNSFTNLVKESFIKGLIDSGNSYEVSDLYKMNFNETLSESEYMREAFYDGTRIIPDDILEEQSKINKADAVVFIYPVFWTEAPAKLVGWFQRVWTYGYAYGDNLGMKVLEKALFLVTMGGSIKDPIRQEQIEAMKVVMLGDRINKRAKNKEMIIFDEMTRGYGNHNHREDNIKKFTQKAYELACSI